MLVARGNIDEIRARLDAKPLKSSASDGRRSTLHAAALAGESDTAVPIIQLLLDAGASFFAEDQDGRTPLGLAVDRGSPAAARALLVAIAARNASWPARMLTSKDLRGWTPLHCAARSRRNGPELLAELMSYISSDPTSARVALRPLGPDAGASAGLTPLMLAALGGESAAVVALLDAGAPVDEAIAPPMPSKRQRGSRATKSARATGSMAVGLTPLILAAREGHDAVVRTLLAHGARAEVEDAEGLTAQAWAEILEIDEVTACFASATGGAVNGAAEAPAEAPADVPAESSAAAAAAAAAAKVPTAAAVTAPPPAARLVETVAMAPSVVAAITPALVVADREDADTVVLVNLELAPLVEVRESSDRGTSCCIAV